MSANVRRFVAGLLMLAANPLSAQTWTEREPTSVRQPGRLQDPRITESSGVVRGRVNPDVLWTLNDSGGDALLYAVDTTGQTRALIRVTARNQDWEALSAGPCGRQFCLWIGDIGDNRAVRPSVVIYRVVEPALGTSDPERPIAPLDSLVIRYPDGPRDAESLIVTRAGDAAIITKGREGSVHLYRVPAAAWSKGDVLLASGGALPIPHAVLFTFARFVTDAALSPTGSLLAVRTYRTIYLFGSSTASPGLPDRPRTSCSVAGLERLGEGIAWWDESTLVLTSERGLRSAPAPITLLECPVR